MACALKDIRFTVRRAGNDAPLLYPRLLRDHTVLPKIAFAIDYFERLVGHERRDLDAELLVNFFGDHKLARCMIASLASSYRFRARRISEVVSRTSVRRFAACGVTAPKLLRLALFDDVNERRSGFTLLDDRAAACCDLAGRLKVRPVEVERVLYLDLDEHAVLQRVGPRAVPEHVAAQFNVGVLEMLLRQAESVELQLRAATPEAMARVTAVAARYGVTVETPNDMTLRFVGRRDALGNWSRHGRKLARATLDVLERGQSDVTAGMAVLMLGHRPLRLRLTPEVLAMLVGPQRGQADWQDDCAARDAVLERVRKEVQRRPGQWTLRRQPEAQATCSGVMLPDLRLHGGDQYILISAVRSIEHAIRLAHRLDTSATGDRHVFVGASDFLQPLRESGATCIDTEAFDVGTLEAVVAITPGTE
ncbi:MAG: DUF790 family protein [Chloroflexota bacterium]